MGLLLPSRGRLFFRLSSASGRCSPRNQFAHILGSYIHRWQPDRSRFVLRVLYKRICPLKRFQHRLISLCIIVPSKRHGDRLFWSIEIGTPNPVGKLLKRKNISGTTAIFFDEAESTVVLMYLIVPVCVVMLSQSSFGGVVLLQPFRLPRSPLQTCARPSL